MTHILNSQNTVYPLESSTLYLRDTYDDKKAVHQFLGLALNPIPANSLLSNEEYIGPLNFDVSISPAPHSKNPWMYSSLLNKVYMDMNQQFPVDFSVENRLMTPLFVRVTPQYSSATDQPVIRCIHHEHHSDSTNADVAEHVRFHIIRCSNTQAHYIGDPKKNEKLSVVVPLQEPQAGNDSVREFFHFVCKGSCPSPGMNRRAVEVIFTLEDETGQVLGRKCLKVRVCACPKRDKAKEEGELEKNGNIASVAKGKKRKVATQMQNSQEDKVFVKEEDSTEYALKISCIGKQNYLKILEYAEDLYKSQIYLFKEQPIVQNRVKQNLVALSDLKRNVQ
ncbi:hypothetical protein ABEB36_006709 [Hypothenemus hampei]